MKRIGLAALLLLTVAACTHRQPAPATAPASEDAAFTGISSYPRAYPVALPVRLPPPPPVAVTNTAPLTATATEPATMAPPPEETNASPTTTNVATADTNAASKAAPTPAAPSSPPPADMTTPSALPASADTSPLPTNAATTGLPAVAPVADPNQVVVLDTSFGRIVIELDDFAAPKTCANFRKLVSTGFYDGTIFHRVIPGFIIQGGDPNTKGPDRLTYGLGDPGYTLPPEIKLHHDQGAVAMARLPDAVNPQRYSNGSQFYICVAACPSLDGQYTVFGHVIDGLDAANRIAAAPADRRNDPLERLSLKATLESRDRALPLPTSAPTGP